MKTELYFVRHAESPFSAAQERVRGLSRQGESDAKRVAHVLAGEQIAAIVSSPYRRAVDTLKPFAEQAGLPIIEYEDLRERPIADLNRDYPWSEVKPAIERSFTEKDYCLPGGESTRQAQARVIPIIEHLLDEYAGRRVAVGTHGNIMTIIFNYYDEQYGFSFWERTSNPDIYKSTFDNRMLVKVERIWS